MPRLVFNGHIAGFGTRAGTRFVVGSWLESPFGRFADVMVEEADGRRSLLAPNADVAEFVSATYMFDSIELGDVTVQQSTDAFRVSAPGLTAEGTLGGAAPFDWLLRWVPARLASAPAWLRAIDPVAARLVPGCARRVARAADAVSITGSGALVVSRRWPARFAVSTWPDWPIWIRRCGSVSRPRLPPRSWCR